MNDNEIKMQKEKLSIFQILKESVENFTSNVETLSNVRKECDRICRESEEKFEEIQKDCEDNSQIRKILFKSLNIKQSKDIEYEKRPDITAADEQLITDACQINNIDQKEVENIKFSLGYKTEKATFKKPCMAVVGQRKSGKSSLINCLLQAKVVPQKAMGQTARVTYITHCSTKFVAHMQNSRLIKIRLNEDVKEDDVELQDRNKKDQISVEIRVGTPNAIIQNGFDIVDSPGLNENPALNELCANMERSLLPLLIYVIDGRNSLTQTDVDDIKQIKSRSPELNVIYFTTKLARTRQNRLDYLQRKKKAGLSESEDMPGESDKDVAQRRLEKSFNKMKEHGLFSNSVQISESRDFHGADIWAVNEIRIHCPEKARSECDDYNHNLINRFEENLMLHLKDMFESPLKDQIPYIQSSQEDALEKAISLLSDVDKSDKLKILQFFNNKENELYSGELKLIKASLEKKLETIFSDNKKRLLETTESGKLKEEKIEQRFEQSLDKAIQDVLPNFMLENERRQKNGFHQDILQKLANEKSGSSSFEIMLRNQLLLQYDFVEEWSRSDSSSEVNSQPSEDHKRLKSIQQLVKSKGRFTQGLFQTAASCEDMETESSSDQHDMSESQRNKIIDRILRNINREKLFKSIHNFVNAELERKHQNFVSKLSEHETLLKCEVGQDEMKCLHSFPPQLAAQYAIVEHVKTQMFLSINPLKPGRRIGEGGRAHVEAVSVIGQNAPIVRKSFKQIFENFDSLPLVKVGLEIYYSSRLNHRRILKLRGIQFEKTDEGLKFSAYYPHLERGTLKQYFECRNREESIEGAMKERMKFCVDLIEGIQFLHSLQIVQGNINLENILVRTSCTDQSKADQFEAVIIDSGLSKSFQLMDDRIEALIYTAPEKFNEDGFTPAMDVFSFGIAAWQLLSYKLTDEYSNYYPKFAERSEASVEKLVTTEENRPEHRNVIPAKVNDYLKKCWSTDPNERPSFISTFSAETMRDKTVHDTFADFLSEIN